MIDTYEPTGAGSASVASRSSPRDFKNPHSWANRISRALWAVAYWTVYRWTPARLGMPWRRLVLRAFGARLGKTYIHPTTRIWHPGRLTAGNDTYVDRDCNIYNAFGCELQDRVVISFETTLCTASHDFTKPTYPLCGAPIVVHCDVWVAACAFVFPGVVIGAGAVVGACSVVTKSVPEWKVVAGNPASIVKEREMSAN